MRTWKSSWKEFESCHSSPQLLLGHCVQNNRIVACTTPGNADSQKCPVVPAASKERHPLHVFGALNSILYWNLISGLNSSHVLFTSLGMQAIIHPEHRSGFPYKAIGSKSPDRCGQMCERQESETQIEAGCSWPASVCLC